MIDDKNQQESLLHPYQAIENQYKFNLTPTSFTDENNQSGNPKMIVEDMDMPFLFYVQKMHQHTMKLTEEELLNLPEVKITALLPYDPSSDACL